MRGSLAVPCLGKWKSGVGYHFLYKTVHWSCKTTAPLYKWAAIYTRYWSETQKYLMNERLITRQIESILSCKRPLTREQRQKDRRGNLRWTNPRISTRTQREISQKTGFSTCFLDDNFSRYLVRIMGADIYCENRSQLSRLENSSDVIALKKVFFWTS